MIIDNFDLVRFSIAPRKTDPPAVVNPDAISSTPVVLKLLKPITGRDLQIVKSMRAIQIKQLPPCNPLNPLKTANRMIVEQARRIRTTERANHISSLVRQEHYVKRNSYFFGAGHFSIFFRIDSAFFATGASSRYFS